MKKLIKVPVRFIWVLVSLMILQACYPGGSIPISDLDTTSTIYNTGDLETPPTSAAIVWEVVQTKVDDGDDLEYDGGADDEILNTTLEELVRMYGVDSVVIISEAAIPDPTPTVQGVKVFYPGSPDPEPDPQTLYAPSVILRNKHVTIVYPGYPWWGGGWWGGWYPGYPCYYCGYPSYGTVTYEVGTVLLEMYDLSKLPSGGPVAGNPIMTWIGIMRGLIGSNSATNRTRVVTGIRQAFEQSPYLDPNK